MSVTVVSRTVAKKALLRFLQRQGALAGCQIAYANPRNVTSNRVVFLGQTTGQVEYPTMTATRKRREDTFTIDVVVTVADPGGDDGETAEESCEEIMGVIESAIADNLLLPEQGTNLPGALSVTVTDMDGPNYFRDEQSSTAQGRLSVQFVMSYQ